jgi:Replication protein
MSTASKAGPPACPSEPHRLASGKVIRASMFEARAEAEAAYQAAKAALENDDEYQSAQELMASCGITSLDPEETAVDTPTRQPGPPPNHPATPEETTWRHRSWQWRRVQVLSALVNLGLPSARVDRMRQCGANAWVEQSTDEPHRLRVRCQCCRDRFCQPCANERRHRILQNLRDQLPVRNNRYRMVTLTLLSTHDPLEDRIRHLYSSFRRLRQQPRCKALFRGGVAFLEITHPHALWHPHLHVLTHGAYLPHGLLKKAWLKATGDSYIVHIGAVPDVERAVTYVAKYATKALSHTCFRDQATLMAAIRALRGTRTITCFGDCQKLRLLRRPPDAVVWYPIVRLQDLIADAHAGDPCAQLMLTTLRNRPAEDVDCDNPDYDRGDT